MRSGQAILVCTFGWGKEFRLYHDYLYVGGKYYRLQELTSVHCHTRVVLRVPSASLELHFKRKKLFLRGIADIEQARRAADYLASWCDKDADAPAGKPLLQRALPSQTLVRTESQPVHALRKKQRPGQAEAAGWQAKQFRSPLPGAGIALHEEMTRSVEAPVWSPPLMRQEPSTRPREATTPVPEEMLPVISVPVRLATGEQAHYSTSATLCGERIQETTRYTYPAVDHGLLILTNKRIIYIGRRSQIVLDYAHLIHVSRLRGALAFEADHWQKRVIFELPEPHSCAACLEAIMRSHVAGNQHTNWEEAYTGRLVP